MADARRLAQASRLFDTVLAASGLTVAGLAFYEHLRAGGPMHLLALGAISLIIIMGRFPLVLTNRAGDAVIGFEASVLVFLAFLYPPSKVIVVWSLAMIIQHSISPHPVRVRMFNIGLTITDGALLVALISAGLRSGLPHSAELAIVVLACAAYFLYDVLLTAVSLALDSGAPLAACTQWRILPLGLACFVAVDTIGYLAVLLERSESPWALVLLLVPIATILLSVDAVSRARLSQQRLGALFTAASRAHEWADESLMERELVAQAQAVLRHTKAELRTSPPRSGELGCLVEVTGSEPRYLVVRRSGKAGRFSKDDQRALEALGALGVAALNRHRLTNQMTHLARPGRTDVAVLYCDLDGFKAVNDRYGHHAGDAVLKACAERLIRCLRPGDVLARLGGDEFALLLPEVASATDALEVAARVHDVIAERFVLDEGEALIGASIGVALAAKDSVAVEVLHNADTAMYRAKASGKGRTEQFEPLMRADVLNRLELEEQLRKAIGDESLSVVFQPIIDLRTGAIDGFEALARWHHPTLGRIAPDVFIPAAERLGLIAALDDYVLSTAHEHMSQLIRRTGARLSLSVNIAPSQVGDPALLESVRSLIARDADLRLILELTEESLLGDDAGTLEALRELTDTGARLAVDDFGVGYSSIGYLHRLPVDRIKIDKSLVQDLAVQRSYLLVQGVVTMARAMDLQVVVEGVEDVQTAVLLRELGCDRAQGYLFSRPVTLEEAEALVREGPCAAWVASPELAGTMSAPGLTGSTAAQSA